MNKSADASAAKSDIQMLMTEIGKLFDANERWKDELEEKVVVSEVRMKSQFDLSVENIRAELVGANRDRIESHEIRISRLERHAGIAK